jgi:hypothetical protein
MTVKELIERLSGMDGDAEVVVGYDATEPRAAGVAPVGFVRPAVVQRMGAYQSPRDGGTYLGSPPPAGGVVAVF